ncbi:MAG: glucose 1-dehydrogenase [Nitriliruptorales bacterium]|nr:glucose 1-dehydrogenase [Nitriliruptorales bacterium]
MLLEDHVAVVTGGARGIGREIALRLGREGADVALLARSVDAMEDVAAQLRDVGRRALVVPTDLRDPEAITAAAERTITEFGHVDTVVNNSGVGGPSAPLWEMALDDWEETFRVNVTGVYLVCKAFIPAMIEQRSGSIVIIGSVTGKRPLLNRTPYAASKLALVGLVRTLAHEVGPHGIRANVISPGGVEGERINWVIKQQAEGQGITQDEARAQFADASPLKRLVAPQDVANAVVFLASEQSAGITGEDMNVSAGLAMY